MATNGISTVTKYSDVDELDPINVNETELVYAFGLYDIRNTKF